MSSVRSPERRRRASRQRNSTTVRRLIAAEGKGAVYPVWKLMEDAGIDFDQSAFLPAVISYYTTTDGKLLSLPFNSSTPVL